MVILAAAAAAVVGVAGYKGGKKAVAGAKNKLEEVKQDRIKDKAYKERKAVEREQQERNEAYDATLSVDDRLARFKREREKEVRERNSSRRGLGRFRKGGK